MTITKTPSLPGTGLRAKFLSPFAKAAALCIAAGALAHSQTAYFMSSGDFTETFDDIADTAAWPDGFLSSEPWAPVAPGGEDPIPSPTRITNSTTALLDGTSSSGGVQRGPGNIYLLSTGGNPGNTSSAAIDLLLDFTNRNAGSLSFDAATVFNGATNSNREGELRLYYTTDGSNWTHITGGGLPYTATNYVEGSQAVSVFLPADLNEAASARFRFYYYNKSSETTVTGSRPKISIDNLLVTSTSAGPDETDPTLAALSPDNGDMSAPIAEPLAISFSEPVVAGAGNVTLYASSAPSVPVQTFPAATGNFQGAMVSFSPTASLDYATSYFVVVDADAFQDGAGNPFGGIPSGEWVFITEEEPLPTPPLIVSLSPESNGTPATAGDVSLSIEYDSNVVAGSGTLSVFDLNDFANENPIATFDINDPADVTIVDNVVTFAAFPATAGVTHNIIAPAGLLRSAEGGIDSQGFGFGDGDVIWFFDVEAPDTTPPVIVSTKPQNGPGASVSNVLVATFDENVTLGSGPWTITVFDVTADETLATFTEADTTSVSALGADLSITLGANLAFENEYRVTLSADVVMDAEGNLSGEVTGDSWRFTTGGPFEAGRIVISQAYGGGGNSGATLTNDFVELHNRSGEPVSVDGWSVQYTSASGSSWNVTPLTGTIQPGGYYLIQQAAGAGGTTALPAPDATGTAAMAGTNGKVALMNSVIPLDVPDPTGDPGLSDFLGYGSANAFEGTGAAPVLSNTTAAIRLVNGSQDTNDNSADFITGSPAPRNSATTPFIPENDGSGIALASNASPSAGSLTGSAIFPSMASGQSVKIDLIGSLQGVDLKTVAIVVPSDFGTPLAENISSTGGTVSVEGNTVTISGATVSTTTGLTVTLSGLTAPDVSADPDDTGTRMFTVRTASEGGILKDLVSSPSVRVAMPVADLATLRAVSLPSPKAYLIPNEVLVTYVESGNFRNQHYIQDSTAGILIDDQPVTLGASYLTGDGLENLAGTLSVFGGVLQFNPIAATAAVSSTGNTPAPILLSLSELNANPLTYQSRLVRVNGVAFQDATGNFANNSVHVLTQGDDTFAFRTFFNAEHSGTAIPSGNLDLIGIVRNLADASAECLSPRSLADFITTPVMQPDYLEWAGLYAGGGAANEDFNGDGVPNGVAYFFGAKTSGFVATPGIVDGSITFPRDSSLTDVSFVVQTSDDLVGWDDVLAENLDLSDPNFITYVLPDAPAPFFVRIAVTVAPPAS